MDGLALKRIAGGSVINNPPLFSENGEILFILIADIQHTVRSYSTNTGELIRDFQEAELEGPEGRIVDIQNLPNQRDVLLGCTNCGKIVTWKIETGKRNSGVKMQIEDESFDVKSFNIVPLGNTHCGLITWTSKYGSVVRIGIFDLNTGKEVSERPPLGLGEGEHKVAVFVNRRILAVIQKSMLFVYNYEKKRSNHFTNAEKLPFAAIACHPEDEVVAVSDNCGRIFLYYDLFKRTNNPKNVLYHWHHYSANTISFTSSGSMLYSGGGERVLVGWHTNTVKVVKTKPRLTGTIVHVSVSADNQKIAVSTDDNAITVVDPEFHNVCVIQNFVRIAEDGTPWPKLPLGLKVDPRTQCIVLNGRAGQIQFYSPFDGNFFNLDTTMENRLSLETGKILYNTRITHVACNKEWLVTAECLNDLQRFPEVRLKFWLFDETRRTYTLSTQIQTPHEGGVTALEFSSPTSVDKLLCASSGLDKKVKVWSMEQKEVIKSVSTLDNTDTEAQTSTEIQKFWVCQAASSYKDLAVNSLAFSSDGSTLAVGFGNALCIYIPETLCIKTVLSAPCGLDGQINKLIISKPTLPKNSKEQNQMAEKRKKNVQMIRAFLENDDDQLLTDIIAKTSKLSNGIPNDRTREVPLSKLGMDDKKTLFKSITEMNDLSLYQKLELFEKIDIPITLPADLRDRFKKYVATTMNVSQREEHLRERFAFLSPNTKYTGQLRLENYLTRRSNAAANNSNLKNCIVDEGVKISNSWNSGNQCTAMETDDDKRPSANPIRKVAKITHVVFATGDCSHFVIVCTENRLLIWNLLTSRLHSIFKLSVNRIVVDPCTSLVAVFTENRELYVFEPSKPYILYQRSGLPKIEGAVWLRRRHPKRKSLDVDWQSFSQLFFLSEQQQLLYLRDVNDEDLLTVKGACLTEVDHFEPPMNIGVINTIQSTDDTDAVTAQRNIAGGLVGDPTRNCVNAIINLQTHTMAPASLLCLNFLTALLSNETNTTTTSRVREHSVDAINSDADDTDSEETRAINKKINDRKEWSRQESMRTNRSAGVDDITKSLQDLSTRSVIINF